jgi:hypothetical protein
MSMVMAALLVRAHLGSVSRAGKFSRRHFGIAAANGRDGVARLHQAHRLSTVKPRCDLEA